VCKPESANQEAACARRILSTLATRAFRRQVSERDAAVDTLMGFFESGRALRGFDNGVTDRCRIVFHQRSSGNIHVEIENLGNVANRYRLEIEAGAPRFSGR